MERLSPKEKNKRFMAERVALLEYMEKTGTSPDEMREKFFDADCIKERIPGWFDVMGEPTTQSAIISKAPEGVETVEASEVIPAIGPEGVPPELLDKIDELIQEAAARSDIDDITKCYGVQWRSICQYVGFWMRGQPFIHDITKEKQRGKTTFDSSAIAKLLPVWGWYCGRYRHPPLVADFVAFVGVSSEWFYHHTGDGVTPAGAELLQKAREIEEAGLNAAVADSKEMPVGRIFLLKARHGYKEASEVIHTTQQRPLQAAELPRLGTEAQ